MRIVVLSDSHMSLGNLFEIVEMHMDTADLFLFLGDIDDDFDQVLSVYPQLKYYRVAGNNDWHSPHPAEQTIMANGKKIFFAHGHTYGVKHGYNKIIEKAKSIKADICLFGHTHTQYSDYNDGLYIMNPGAVCSYKYAMIDIVSSGIALITTEI